MTSDRYAFLCQSVTVNDSPFFRCIRKHWQFHIALWHTEQVILFFSKFRKTINDTAFMLRYKMLDDSHFIETVIKRHWTSQIFGQCFCRYAPKKNTRKKWYSFLIPRSEELRTQTLKSDQVRTQSLNVLPTKPEVGQYIAIHATLTAKDFFLVYFYLPVHSPAFFSKISPDFSCVDCG